MASLLHKISRDGLLRLGDVTSPAFLKRAMDDHLALAFGCEVPAVRGEYLTFDGVAMVLTDYIVHHGVCQRKSAATLVRFHDEPWFNLAQRAEWGPDGLFVFLAVGWWRYFDDGLGRAHERAQAAVGGKRVVGGPQEIEPHYTGLVVLSGTLKEIAEAQERMVKEGLGVPQSLVLINMNEVLSVVQWRALKHDIKLPLNFTAEPGTPADAAMRTEIADYQKRSQARLRAKGRRRVPVPRSMRMSEVM